MKRPIPVTILGCLFIVAGLVGLAYHLSQRPLDRWVALISFIRVLAVLGGVFLLYRARSAVAGGGLFPAYAAGLPVFSGFAFEVKDAKKQVFS